MKIRDISISIVVIAVSVLLLYSYFQGKGAIDVRAGGADVDLNLSCGLFGKATIHSGTSPAEIRARIHRPKSLRLSMQQDGDTWQFESTGPWGEMSTVKVRNGDTAVLELGPPFTIKPVVRGARPQIFMDLKIYGRTGEQYRNVIMRNGKRIASPKLEIVDEKGNVLTTGRFEYG